MDILVFVYLAALLYQHFMSVNNFASLQKNITQEEEKKTGIG